MSIQQPLEPAVVARARKALRDKDAAYAGGFPQTPFVDDLAASMAELILSHERYRHDAEALGGRVS